MSKQPYLFRFMDVPRQPPQKQPPEQRITHHREIYHPFGAADAAMQSSRCLDCGNPYCARGCPVHNDIPGWLKMVRDGHLIEACEHMHSTNPLPEICGRVCPQERLCEGACTLEHTEFGAVTIGSVEHWVVDEAFRQGWRPDLSRVRETGQRVAIVGAGPAGLACAERLRRAGIGVDVFDRHDEVGGLLIYGIPSFKLDKDVIRLRRTILEGMGVRFHLNTEIGRDIALDELLHDYDAVFAATGAYRALDGKLPGLQLEGVHQALPFLIDSTRRLQRKDMPVDDNAIAGKRVIVLGGGDTAMDCVRTAVRLRAGEVTCVYRRDQESMPGSVREVVHAHEEGVDFRYHCQPQALLGDALEVTGAQRVEGVRVVATERIEGGPDGTRLVHVDDSEQVLAADVVVIAFGFRAEAPAWCRALGVKHDAQGRIRVGGSGRLAQQTSNPRVFAGGDMVRGADLVVRAVHDGREAAASIVRHLAKTGAAARSGCAQEA
ncbi:MAG TPA: FAD-dependent oxidoreductase [Rhodanobacteraceae bacterium]|nr:FAD-dependent oxidoreductase [Rhodanobacteraceae bacterium]